MKQALDQRTLRWLWNIETNNKGIIAALLLLQALISILALGRVLVLKDLIDHAVAGQTVLFWKAVLLIFAVIAVQITLRALWRYCDEYSRSGLENSFKERLLVMLLKKDYATVSESHSEEWMTRLTADSAAVADGLVTILPGTVGLLVQFFGAAVVLFRFQWKFALILVAAGIPLLLLTWLLRRKLKQFYHRIQEADGRLRVFLQDRISNMLIVRSFSQEEETQKQSRAKMQEHQKARMERMSFFNFCQSGLSVAVNLFYMLGILYGGCGLLNGTLTYGSFTAVLQLIGQLQAPLGQMSGYLSKIYSTAAAAERLMAIETLPDHEKIRLDNWNSIGMHDADFTYRSKMDGQNKTLSSVNLEVQRKEYVAFVGPSGCGKSTALKLLMGLYPLDRGLCYVVLDGKRQTLSAMPQDFFAYVPQGNQLFSGSIREIITFGKSEDMKQDQKIWSALKIACADTFVKDLQLDLDSPLGERGAGLSEGQIQRIAIARAVYSDNPVLLLDEATSSLDEQTEAAILRNLRDMTEKTVIIVTHRPAALSVVDKVVDFGQFGG